MTVVSRIGRPVETKATPSPRLSWPEMPMTAGMPSDGSATIARETWQVLHILAVAQATYQLTHDEALTSILGLSEAIRSTEGVGIYAGTLAGSAEIRGAYCVALSGLRPILDRHVSHQPHVIDHAHAEVGVCEAYLARDMYADTVAASGAGDDYQQKLAIAITQLVRLAGHAQEAGWLYRPGAELLDELAQPELWTSAYATQLRADASRRAQSVSRCAREIMAIRDYAGQTGAVVPSAPAAQIQSIAGRACCK